MPAERILSLLPSATEIVRALDLTDRLVGVTHECDAPPAIPRVTRGVVDPDAPAGEIHSVVQAHGQAHRSLDRIDEEAIRRGAPDLILTQTLCAVCAVPWEEAARLLERAAPGASLLDLAPRSLADVARDIERVAEAAGVPERGRAARAAFADRIEAVRRRTAGRPRRPVLLLEWTDPPFVGAHWVPEMIVAAGGAPLHAPPAGEKARARRWADLLPLPAGALVAAAPCGFSVDRTLRELARAPLPVPTGTEVWALDGGRHWARPGPNLAEGIEALAALLHADLGPPDPSAARRVS